MLPAVRRAFRRPDTGSAGWYRGTTSHRIPVVLYGEVGFDPAAVTSARFHGAAPDTTTIVDVDGDGLDDLWLEYELPDVTRLSATASYVGLSDTDEDGIHDACDACPTVGHPRGPDGCPP